MVKMQDSLLMGQSHLAQYPAHYDGRHKIEERRQKKCSHRGYGKIAMLRAEHKADNDVDDDNDDSDGSRIHANIHNDDEAGLTFFSPSQPLESHRLGAVKMI